MKDGNQVRRSKSTFNDPIKWADPRLIFTCSLSDFFLEEADEWRPEAWDIIRRTPHHTYQILTKRPERVMACLPDDWGDGWDNVWLGISAENEELLHKRMRFLIPIPAKVKYISAEPLLEEIDMSALLPYRHNIDWLIAGGESGNDHGLYRYRECSLRWLTEIKEVCMALDIPLFVKQLGTHLAKKFHMKDRHGGNFDEFPRDLQVRQMPFHYQKLTR